MSDLEYCSRIGRGGEQCASAVNDARTARDESGTPSSWSHQFLSYRSIKKGFTSLRFRQVNEVPFAYVDHGCPSFDLLPEQSRLVEGAKIALAKGREAYARALALGRVMRMVERPASYDGSWRADHHFPDAPTDDPRAKHAWLAYLATEEFASCLRKIPDPMFVEDLARPPAAHALWLLRPSEVLAHTMASHGAFQTPLHDAASGVKGLASEAAQDLEIAIGHLALFVQGIEQNILGAPFTRAVDLTRKAVYIAAGVLVVRAAWRWLT